MLLLMVLYILQPLALSERYTNKQLVESVKWTYEVTEPGYITSTAADPTAKSISLTPGTATRKTETQFYQEGDPVKINKYIYSSSFKNESTNHAGKHYSPDEGYFPGDTLVVFTEVIPITRINGLAIWEHVDEGLNISNTEISPMYKFSNFKDVIECKIKASHGCFKIDYTDPFNIEGSLNSYYIEKINSIGYVETSLEKPSRLLYWYGIKTNESGKYAITTHLRFYDSKAHDIEYITEIDIKPPDPKFEVGVTISQKEVSKNEVIGVIYDISYLGGMGNRKQYIKIIFKDTDYCKYVTKIYGKNDTDKSIEIILDQHEVKNIEKHLLFNKSGTFPLPCIEIHAMNYTFEKAYPFENGEVVVKDFWERWSNYILVAFSIIAVILGPIYGSIKCPWRRDLLGHIIFILVLTNSILFVYIIHNEINSILMVGLLVIILLIICAYAFIHLRTCPLLSWLRLRYLIWRK